MTRDSFIAELDDNASEIPVRNATDQCWYKNMDTDWEEERLSRDKTYKRMLAGRNPERIRQGIEAYKRDLPQLLRDHKERYFVAYDGDTRLGLATTREQLFVELKQSGIYEHVNLLIKMVSSLEDNRETLSAHNHR